MPSKEDRAKNDLTLNAKLRVSQSGKKIKVSGRKVSGADGYDVYVLAYKLADGKKITLGKTITAHIVGRMNMKYTNVKAVKVKKSSYRLKKGKTVQIKASAVLVSPGKKQLSNAHVRFMFIQGTDMQRRLK